MDGNSGKLRARVDGAKLRLESGVLTEVRGDKKKNANSRLLGDITCDLGRVVSVHFDTEYLNHGNFVERPSVVADYALQVQDGDGVTHSVVVPGTTPASITPRAACVERRFQGDRFKATGKNWIDVRAARVEDDNTIRWASKSYQWETSTRKAEDALSLDADYIVVASLDAATAAAAKRQRFFLRPPRGIALRFKGG